MPEARRAYEEGASLRTLKRRFDMSRSEIEDVCPEEFETATQPDSMTGGY